MKTRMILVTLTLTLAGASALSAQQRDNRGSDNRSPGNDTRNDARNDARPSNDSNRNDDRYAPGNGSRNNDRNDDRYDRSDNGYAYNSPPPPQAPSDHSYGRRSASPGPGYIWIDGYWIGRVAAMRGSLDTGSGGHTATPIGCPHVMSADAISKKTGGIVKVRQNQKGRLGLNIRDGLFLNDDRRITSGSRAT